MGQYDSVYSLTMEEIVDKKPRLAVNIPIEVGTVFDSEGVLHLDRLREIYDAAVKKGRDEKADKDDKAGEGKPSPKKLKKK